MSNLLSQSLITKSGLVPADAVFASRQIKYLGLYFCANWCPPCASFTQSLINFYTFMKTKCESLGGEFEVIFISLDHNQKAFDKYFAIMPWLAVPFEDRLTKERLEVKYKVSGIPVLIILDCKSGKVLNINGREKVMEDPWGVQFPWPVAPITEILGTSLSE